MPDARRTTHRGQGFARGASVVLISGACAAFCTLPASADYPVDPELHDLCDAAAGLELVDTQIGWEGPPTYYLRDRQSGRESHTGRLTVHGARCVDLWRELLEQNTRPMSRYGGPRPLYRADGHGSLEVRYTDQAAGGRSGSSITFFDLRARPPRWPRCVLAWTSGAPEAHRELISEAEACGWRRFVRHERGDGSRWLFAIAGALAVVVPALFPLLRRYDRDI